MTLPVPADGARLLRRLVREERAERRELARLEARLRRFEDVERPAYDAWLRLELGPALGEVEDLAALLRARQMLAERVTALVEDEGLPPREALWFLRESGAQGVRGAEDRAAHAARERAEVEARRRAKRERKRMERKRARRARQATSRDATRAAPGKERDEDAATRERIVTVYRALARRLHPDSPRVVRALAPARLRAVWAEVQAAYALRSLERLLALATWLETVAAGGADADAEHGDAGDEGRGAAPPGLLSLAERHERLRIVRRAARMLARRLAALADAPAWDFPGASPRLRRKRKQEATRRIAGERDALRAALAAVDAFLEGLGPPRAPRTRRR